MAPRMSTKIRSRVALIIPIVFVIFIGCGGGDDKQPPPPPPGMKQPDQAALMELQMKANQMKQACTRNFAVVLMPALQNMQRGMPMGSQPFGAPGMQQQPPLGAQIVNPNAMAGSMGGAGGQVMGQPGTQAPPIQQDCYQASMNFIMDAKTFMNGQGIAYPPFRSWVEDQFKGVGNRVAGVLGSQGIDLNNPQLRSAALAIGNQMLQQQMPQIMSQLGGLPPGIQSGIQSTISSAVSGMRAMR